jgi:transcription elongation factor Elf1
MSNIDFIEVALQTHQIKCPNCDQQTVHNWPGDTILFATATCIHCGEQFLIAFNQPQTEVSSLEP